MMHLDDASSAVCGLRLRAWARSAVSASEPGRGPRDQLPGLGAVRGPSFRAWARSADRGTPRLQWFPWQTRLAAEPTVLLNRLTTLSVLVTLRLLELLPLKLN